MKCPVVVVALALAGCSDHQPAPPPPPEPGAVTVVRAGLEPRRAVRYALAKGTKTTLELDVDNELHADQMGGPIPTLEITFEFAVEDVLPDGRMHVRTTVLEAAARDRAGATVDAAALATPLAQLRGLAIAGTLSPDGTFADARLDTGDQQLPSDVSAQLTTLSQTLQQLAMPLPRDPVGTGAEWNSTRQLDVDGMKLTSTSTVELVALADHELAFTVTTELSGADQQVQRAGIAIDVTHAHGSGAGAGTLDLSTLAMTSTMSQQMHADYTAAGVHTAMDMTTRVETRPR